MNYSSIDLFAGVGGLSQGMIDAGFAVKVALEINADAVKGYRLNHPETIILQEDIRKVRIRQIKKSLKGQPLHLLAGCPPCQGFSSVRRLNREQAVEDDRNSLVTEFARFIWELEPMTFMMENVPGLKNYDLFQDIVSELKKKYSVDVQEVNVKDYGVPQRRKRLVMVGSLLGDLKVAKGTGEKKTVRHFIEDLESIETTEDEIHKVVAIHSDKIMNRIKLTPKNGGSRKDLPEEFMLDCHKKENIGFNDIYGRLRWDDYSSTITGGCLNPSKGRFLHPEYDRCITAREAALLQSFPKDYKFPIDIKKDALALLIGNALPPKFSFEQCLNIKQHLDQHLGR